MELTLINILFSIGAGILSILAPCILPILPGIVATGGNDNKFRPLLIVIGLSITFITMGILSSAFGSLLVGKTIYMEKIGGLIILLIGLFTIFSIDVFKKLTILQRFKLKSDKKILGPLFLGFSLGIIWIPCTGPILSSVLTLVASKGDIVSGIILLIAYSVGFSIPMLAIGYSSGYIQKKISIIYKNPKIVNYVSGGLLTLLGLYILFAGSLAFF